MDASWITQHWVNQDDIILCAPGGLATQNGAQKNEKILLYITYNVGKFSDANSHHSRSEQARLRPMMSDDLQRRRSIAIHVYAEVDRYPITIYCGRICLQGLGVHYFSAETDKQLRRSVLCRSRSALPPFNSVAITQYTFIPPQ